MRLILPKRFSLGNAIFSRGSTAYLDNRYADVGIPRIRRIGLSKMIMVEEGTTNLFTNPGWLDGTLTGWTKHSDESATGIRTVESDSKYGYRLKLERTGGQPSDRFGISQSKTWSASGSSLTISVYFKVVSAEEGAKLRIYTDFRNPSDTPYYGRGALVDLKTFEVTPVYGGKASVQALEDGWYYFTCTPSETDNSKGPIYFWIEGGNAQIYLAWSQLEAKPYATSFIDGTRAAETLTIPTAGVLNPQEGTVECWVYVNDIIKRQLGDISNGMVIHILRLGGSLGIYLSHRGDSPVWEFRTHADDNTYTTKAVSNSYTPNGWHFFALRWSLDRADLFIDGVLRGTISNPKLPSGFYDIAYVGSWGDGLHINTLIDDLRISSRARTDEEIAAAYQSGQPLPVDAWTTLKLDFNGNLNAQRGATQ